MKIIGTFCSNILGHNASVFFFFQNSICKVSFSMLSRISMKMFLLWFIFSSLVLSFSFEWRNQTDNTSEIIIILTSLCFIFPLEKFSNLHKQDACLTWMLVSNVSYLFCSSSVDTDNVFIKSKSHICVYQFLS